MSGFHDRCVTTVRVREQGAILQHLVGVHHMHVASSWLFRLHIFCIHDREEH